MARSNSKQFNVRAIPLCWQNHTVDPPISWEEWSDLFQLSVIAKKNFKIKNVLKPVERYHPLPLLPGNPPDSETEIQKADA